MQSWYDYKHLARIAQIWKYVSDEDPERQNTNMERVKEFYELEFKLYAIKNRPFKGLPQRKENIIHKLEDAFRVCCHSILEMLQEVFAKWLSEHALMNPIAWATQRAQYTEDEYNGEINVETLQGIIDEHLRYLSNNHPVPFSAVQCNQEWYKWTSQIAANLDKFPSVQKAVFNNDYVSDQQNYYYDMLSSDGYEEFGRMVGQTFVDENAAQEYIDNLDISQLSNTLDMDMETFCTCVNGWGQGTECVKELNAFFVFPYWLNYWKNFGMEETRNGIEEIYQMMQDAVNQDDLGKLSAAVSAGLNAYHVNGSMIDYCDDLSKHKLSELTEGSHVPKCLKELKNIGVDVTGMQAKH